MSDEILCQGAVFTDLETVIKSEKKLQVHIPKNEHFPEYLPPSWIQYKILNRQMVSPSQTITMQFKYFKLALIVASLQVLAGTAVRVLSTHLLRSRY